MQGEALDPGAADGEGSAPCPDSRFPQAKGRVQKGVSAEPCTAQAGFLPSLLTPKRGSRRLPLRRRSAMIQKARVRANALVRGGTDLYKEMALSVLSLVRREA